MQAWRRGEVEDELVVDSPRCCCWCPWGADAGDFLDNLPHLPPSATSTTSCCRPLPQPIAPGLLSAMGEYTIQISTKLIDEKVKRKVRKPRPKKVVEQQAEEPQDNASRELPSEPKSSPAPAPATEWSLPVTPAPPPPPSPAIQEVEAIRTVVAESAKVLEKLDKAEAERQQELARRAKELHDSEFKLLYQNPVPCADEKAGCLECYVSNAAQDPLKCAEAVRRFEACVRMARQSSSVSGVATK